MSNALRVTGVEGQLRWGYLPAITFGPWSYDGHGPTGTLTAQIVHTDDFRSTQRPLVAVVSVGRAQWRWAVTDLTISGGTLTASVARQ